MMQGILPFLLVSRACIQYNYLSSCVWMYILNSARFTSCLCCCIHRQPFMFQFCTLWLLSRSTLWGPYTLLRSEVTLNTKPALVSYDINAIHSEGTTDQLLFHQRFPMDIKLDLDICYFLAWITYCHSICKTCLNNNSLFLTFNTQYIDDFRQRK